MSKHRPVARIVLRVIREQYTRHGLDDRFSARDWDDARRRASYLCRRDLNAHRFGDVVDKFHILQRRLASDPDLVDDQRSDEGRALAVDIDRDLVNLRVSLQHLTDFDPFIAWDDVEWELKW